MRTLVWFRGRDLRVEDQPALRGAEGSVIPCFLIEPGALDISAAPFRVPLLRAYLQALRQELQARGSDLVVVEGPAEAALPRLIEAWGISAVRTMRRIEPSWRARDLAIGQSLSKIGVSFDVLEGDTLSPPGELRTGTGGPFQVFTPFARAFHRQVAVPRPLPAPPQLLPLPLGLAFPPWPWDGVAAEAPGVRVQFFLNKVLPTYAVGRDQMGWDGTSRLSSPLRFGALSVRKLWADVQAQRGQGFDRDIDTFLNELLWREFAHHTLFERPELVSSPFRERWQHFPWREDPAGLEAWKLGQTGFPIVDAAARELLTTGYVHNRARMISASFLTKHLLVDWREGEAHYRHYLADHDQASNVLGWQWCAGCGVDAQPWFRIFNPETQAKRFDTEGAYRARWAVAHPLEPMVDLAFGRARFLAAAKAHLG